MIIADMRRGKAAKRARGEAHRVLIVGILHAAARADLFFGVDDHGTASLSTSNAVRKTGALNRLQG
jgi:hypothetical protein